MSMPSQLVTVVTEAGAQTAYARADGREHQATSSSAELAARLAAAGVHRVQLPDVASAERLREGMWRVTFRHGALVQEAAR